MTTLMTGKEFVLGKTRVLGTLQPAGIFGSGAKDASDAPFYAARRYASKEASRDTTRQSRGGKYWLQKLVFPGSPVVVRAAERSLLFSSPR